MTEETTQSDDDEWVEATVIDTKFTANTLRATDGKFLFVEREDREELSEDTKVEVQYRPAEPHEKNAVVTAIREPTDQTTDVSDTTMTETYTTMFTDEAQSETTTDDQWDWGYSDHTTASSDDQASLSETIRATMDQLDEDIDEEMLDVLEDASELVEGSTVSQFECSHEQCGLGHGHPDWKHDITASTDTSELRSNIPGFNITSDFADQMEFVRNCHCGANEAAMLVEFYPYINIQMFSDGENFEGVNDVEPQLINEMYRLYSDEDASVSQAAGTACRDIPDDEAEAVPLGVRDDITAFFERREQMEQQASKAPIHGETREAINENREALEAELYEA